jgi:hypothetical protein
MDSIKERNLRPPPSPERNPLTSKPYFFDPSWVSFLFRLPEIHA